MALPCTREGKGGQPIQPSQGGRFLFGRKTARTADTTQNSIAAKQNTFIFPRADLVFPPYHSDLLEDSLRPWLRLHRDAPELPPASAI
jgi:hypothetical protein